jgi:hypothetical protein
MGMQENMAKFVEQASIIYGRTNPYSSIPLLKKVAKKIAVLSLMIILTVYLKST